MRKLLLGLVSLGAVTIAAPAQSQVSIGAGPVGVEVGGPTITAIVTRTGVGVIAATSASGTTTPTADCRVVRERIETPSGRVIIKTRRSC